MNGQLALRALTDIVNRGGVVALGPGAMSSPDITMLTQTGMLVTTPIADGPFTGWNQVTVTDAGRQVLSQIPMPEIL